MKSQTLITAAVATLLGWASTAGAQVIAKDDWTRGTTLATFAGASTSSDTTPAFGASVGWEVLPLLTIDGSGVWFPRHEATSAFTALLGARVNVLPPGRLVPFLSGGVGVYRTAVDSRRGAVPAFYRSRMTMGGTLQTERVFDDLVFSVGGGADLFLQRHVALRPDVRVLLVRTSTGTRTVAVYGVHLAIHFESHPVTP